MKLIAELCQNHNGDYEILKDMVYAAKENGATHVKTQHIFSNMLSFRSRFEKGSFDKDGNIEVIKRPYDLEYSRLKTLEISIDDQARFVELCKKIGIVPMTTIFTKDSVNVVKEMGFEEIKVASYDCASIPLIRELKYKFKKLYVSTGSTYDEEIEKTANELKGIDYSFFHCVTIYPTPLNQFNLKRINYLKNFTKEVGWSDHSLVQKDGIIGTAAAIYYGADIIERHFTILNPSETKDGPVSINPSELNTLSQVASMPDSELKQYLDDKLPNHNTCLGSERRELSKDELLNRDYYRGRFVSKINGKEIFNWEIN